MSAQTELAVVPPKETALQVYQATNGLDPYLKKIRDEIDAFVPDVSSRKGREAIASIAYKVARSKTALDNVGKDLVADLKEIPKKIDAERKRMRDTLDAWQEEVRRPLNDWQADEDARVEKHNSMIRHIEDCGLGLIGGQPQPFALLFRELEEKIIVDEKFEEFEAEAHRAKTTALAKLKTLFEEHQKREAEQAELERLRREAEERAEQDRIRLAQEAAVEAERQRVAQQQQAEREAAARREQELLDQAAAQEREAESQRLQLKLQAEQAERARIQAEADRVAADQRAEQERQAAARRAEEAAELARQDERRRADAAAAEIVRQQQARERDEAHRRSINRAALEAFIAGGMPEACAKQAVTLIAQRKIPNVSISY